MDEAIVMLNKIFYRIIFLILLINCKVIYAANSIPGLEQKFITIADIHFDPFVDCKKKQTCELINKLNSTSYKDWEKQFEQFGSKKSNGYYHDTNYALLKLSLNAIKKTSEQVNPQFVLVLGDFLGHNYRERYREFSKKYSEQAFHEFVKKTLQFLTLELQNTFPNINVYPVIGNNDSYTGDYSIVPNGAFLKDASQIWAPLIKNNQSSFLSTFSTGGYYQLTVPEQSSNKIIVLNTVLFSDRNHKKNVKEAALKQLNWLHQQLVSARKLHQHVILAYHIPIGIDVLATIRNKFDIKEFWQAAYTETFEKELNEFADIVTAILPAHIHMDTFQLITIKQLADIPVLFTPSISPIFGNDPGYKVFNYIVDTFHINHIDTYFYQLNSTSPSWKQEYTLNTQYHYGCDNNEKKKSTYCVYLA